MRYSLEPNYRRYVKGYMAFCHLPENLEINMVKN